MTDVSLRKDIYDEAISYFENNSEEILPVWDDPRSHWTGVLFSAVTPNGIEQKNPFNQDCGDICRIRSLEAYAWTRELTSFIQNDTRIPPILDSNNGMPKISIDSLKIFAEWQRKIDTALNRDPKSFIDNLHE